MLSGSLCDGRSLVILQLNIVLRNSGTYDGASIWLFRQLGWMPEAPSGPSDALFQLQFFARLAIQFDLADLTAMFAVPALVTLYVWRDGWFVLEGTGVTVCPSDVLNMWSHFAILLVIKPCSFWVARRILERKMALTLLGYKTLHGRSAIVLKAMENRQPAAETASKFSALKAITRRMRHRDSRPSGEEHRKVVSSLSGDVKRDAGGADASQMEEATADGGGRWGALRTQGMASLFMVRSRSPSGDAERRTQTDVKRSVVKQLAGARRITDRFVLDQAFDQFGFSEERKAVIARDFAVSHLQYAHLFAKIIRRSSFFFAVVVLFQLFAVLPRHSYPRYTRIEPQLAYGVYGDTNMLPFRAAGVFLNYSRTGEDIEIRATTRNCTAGRGWEGGGFLPF